METTPSQVTPNVVLANPAVRKGLNWIVGGAAIVVPALALVDANSAVDFSAWMPAATAVTSFLAGLLGLVVTVPNIPSAKAAVVKAEAVVEPGVAGRDDHGV